MIASAVAGLAIARPVEATHGRAWVSLYDRPADGAAAALVRGDGQFFSMLAQDPTLSRPEVQRTSPADFAYRAARPGYGWLGWVVSGGQASLVPWVMLLMTVASTVLLAWAVLRATQSPIAAVGVVALPGVVTLLGWSGPEVLAAALAVVALNCCLKGRETPAAMALVGAVLLRETLLLVALGLALAGLLKWWRAVVPALALGAWWTVVTWRIAWPSGSASRLKLFGFVSGEWGLVALLTLAGLVVLSAVALTRCRRLAVAMIAPHLALGLVTGSDVWVIEGWTRVFVPLFALLLALAFSPREQTVDDNETIDLRDIVLDLREIPART